MNLGGEAGGRGTGGGFWTRLWIPALTRGAAKLPPVVLPSSARRAVSLPAEAARLSGAAAGDLDGRLNPGCVNR